MRFSAPRVFAVLAFLFSLLFLWFAYNIYQGSFNVVNKTVATISEIQGNQVGLTFVNITDGTLQCDKQFNVTRIITSTHGNIPTRYTTTKNEVHTFAPLVDTKNNVLFVDYSQMSQACPTTKTITGQVEYAGYSGGTYDQTFYNDMQLAEKTAYKNLNIKGQAIYDIYFATANPKGTIYLVYVALFAVVVCGIITFVVFKKE